MSVVQTEDGAQIGSFFDYIFEDQEGYIYVAHKVPQNQYKFNQTFFQWPTQRAELVDHVLKYRANHEVYYAPALFGAPSALKEHIKGALVYWCEFDGKVPSDVDLENSGLPKPTLRVLSSETGHEHWYWKLESLVEVSGLERVNRAITYLLGADTSGWDANQILRPPATFNHKRGRAVVVCGFEQRTASPEEFTFLPEPPPPLDTPIPERVPDVQEVVFKHKFPEHVTRLFKVGQPVGKRSQGMMALGFYLAELNLTNEEMFSLLLNADQRWGKFDGRSDQAKRLMEIVTIARQKYPFHSTDQAVGSPAFQPMGYLSLLRSEFHIEWLWEGFLQKAGYMLLTGPSQVGKTQFALDLATSVALGQPFLDTPCSQGRVGFFSLEMNGPELKEFVSAQSLTHTEEDMAILEENLLIFALGEPIYLNREETRQQIEQTIKDFELDGVFFDSMGSTTSGSLSDETSIKEVLDWNDSLRQRSGVFSGFIHHHRKANGDNKRPNKLSDVYGNQYITARATSVICLWETGVDNVLDFLPLKVRLTKNPGKFPIRRGVNLRFTREVGSLVQETPKEEDSGLDHTTEPGISEIEDDISKKAEFNL